MKKPDSKTTAKSTAKPEAAKTDDATRDDAAKADKNDAANANKDGKKKAAATSATVESKPVPAGSASKAAEKGGEVKPAESALLGQNKDDKAAAAKKTTAASGASSQTDRLASVDKPSDEAKQKQADAGKSSAATGEAAKPAKPSEPARSTAPQPAQKSGFLPTALGGAVAAGIGAAVALWLLPQEPAVDGDALKQEILAEVQSGTGTLRDEAVAAAREEVSAQIDGVSSQASEAGAAAGAEAARQVIADLPSGESTAPELQAALEAQSQQISDLADRLSALESSASSAEPASSGSDDGASEALQQEMTALRDQIQQAADDVQSRLEAVRAEAEKTQSQLDSVKAEADEMQAAAESSTKRAEAVAAIAALKAAIEEGASTDEPLQQLQDAGVAAPDAVQADVPTLPALQDRFDPAAREALRAALRDRSPDASGGTLIGNFLRAQIGARSVEPREGDDPDAVLSRAGSAVQGGDIEGALQELQALPEAARQASSMATWLSEAQAFTGARAALNDLAGQTN